MTAVYRDALGTVLIHDVKHIQILDNTVYFEFLDGEDTTEKNIEIVEVLA